MQDREQGYELSRGCFPRLKGGLPWVHGSGGPGWLQAKVSLWLQKLQALGLRTRRDLQSWESVVRSPMKLLSMQPFLLVPN